MDPNLGLPLQPPLNFAEFGAPARGQHTHYPEPPTSPGVMSTDLDQWKPELGCLKDYSLEVKFKPDVTPTPPPPPDSASRAQYHSVCKKTSTNPMMSESRKKFGSL